MAAEHRFDRSARTLIIRYSGDVTDGDVQALATAVAADSTVAPGSHVLIDLREVVHVRVTPQAVRTVAGSGRLHALKFCGLRTAIVSTRKTTYGLSRLYEIIAEDAGIPMLTRGFRALDDAVNWLMKDEMPQESGLALVASTPSRPVSAGRRA